MNLHRALLFVLALPALLIAGCGGSSGGNPPAAVISVAFSAQPPSSLVAGATASLTAVVTNDSASAGVTWTAACGTSSCGSFSPAGTASGAATVYTAPSAATTVTVTVTSVTDKTKSATASITVTAAPPPAITVTLSPQPPASLTTNATTSLTAVVANDSANAGVTWTVTCALSACGSFSPAATASGAATTYTAPAAATTVTVVATSVTDKTKSASASITIAAPPPPASLLNDGTYVFHASGQDKNSTYTVAGAFTIKGGVITGGEQDFIDYSVGQTDQISASGSSLTKTTDGNLQLVLNTGDTNIGVSGVETFNGILVSGSRVLITQYDTSAASVGSIDLQTSTAAPTSGYAFVVSGPDNTQQGNLIGVGGIISFNGTALNTGGSVFDCDDNGVATLNQPFTSGSFSAPDSYGRLTFTLVPNTSCGLAQMIFAGYINSNQIQLVENVSDTYGGSLGGTALAQGGNTGKFNASTLNSSTYAFSSLGEDTDGTLSLAGGFSFGIGGSLSGNIAVNDLSAWGVNTITGGAWAVDPTGRVTLTNVVISGGANNSSVTLGFQVYLDGNGNALTLGVDTIQLTAGQGYLQTSGGLPSSGSAGLLAQGIVPYSDGSSAYWSAVGPMALSTNAFSGPVDYNPQGSALQSAQNISATVNTATGVITLSGLDPNYQSDSFGYYPIDGSRFLAIEVDGNQLGLLQAEPVQTQ